MKKIMVLAAALSLVVLTAPSSVFAQVLGNQNEVVETNDKKKQNFAPDPIVTTKQECTFVTLKLPAIDTKTKPASYSPTVRDERDGLVEAMKACNPNSEIVAFVPNSSRTVRIKVTQGADGVAYLKLPTDRLDRLQIAFFIKAADWKEARYWVINGPVAKNTELVFVAKDEKDAPKVFN